MDFFHDAHDWLGGYPYETASQKQTDAASLYGMPLGYRQTKIARRLFGSGCSEFVFQKLPTD
jgi:2-polyprenyl-6-hydroxyphenyl methylase/3-demethylubiquinone-9 3-methyltransferase